MKAKHKYRVNVYLGKELYQELEQMAVVFGISVSTLAKILLNTGYELGKTLDAKEGDKNGGK